MVDGNPTDVSSLVLAAPVSDSPGVSGGQVEAIVDLGVAQPSEFALALLHIVKVDKAAVLRMGHWPRRKATNATPQTVYALQLTKLGLSFAGILRAAYSARRVSSRPLLSAIPLFQVSASMGREGRRSL